LVRGGIFMRRRFYKSTLLNNSRLFLPTILRNYVEPDFSRFFKLVDTTGR
jgi:hypothetical protein